MHRLLGYLAVFGTIFSIDSVHARSGASECPTSMSIDDLLRIAAKPAKSTVEWRNALWTLYSKGGDFPPIGTTNYIIRMENPRNDSGLLKCDFRITSHIPRTNALITLSIAYTGMKK